MKMISDETAGEDRALDEEMRGISWLVRFSLAKRSKVSRFLLNASIGSSDGADQESGL
jgi:hypothetical protein